MKARQEFDTEQEYKEYLRTYFAAMAMQGLINNMGQYYINANQQRYVAEMSLTFADELLTQLNNQSK